MIFLASDLLSGLTPTDKTVVLVAIVVGLTVVLAVYALVNRGGDDS